jgi:hypothetical protein
MADAVCDVGSPESPRRTDDTNRVVSSSHIVVFVMAGAICTAWSRALASASRNRAAVRAFDVAASNRVHDLTGGFALDVLQPGVGLRADG